MPHVYAEAHSLKEGPFQPRYHRVVDDSCGLLAFVVIDDTSLGPACGGIRTRVYANENEALEEGRALARSMTYKCALAALPAGGGKGVVMLSPETERERAFERLGQFIDSLGGEFLTAGDLGTTAEDLDAMARHTEHVYTDEVGMAAAVGRGCLRAMEGSLSVLDGDAFDGSLAGLSVAVQGCGTVGAAVAAACAEAGADVVVADLDDELAARVAEQIGARTCAADSLFTEAVDVLSPCAVGGVVNEQTAVELNARVVCGAANNILAAEAAEDTLRERGILYVPSPLSSAGAVVEGVGKTILGLADCSELIDKIGVTTQRVLAEALSSRRRAGEVARQLAQTRISAARGEPGTGGVGVL